MARKNWIPGLGAASAAALALLAVPAHAGGASIHLNIGTGYYHPQPYVYSQPSYVYTQPGYVYTQPSYVYTQPSYVYTQPSYVYVQPGHVYYAKPRHHRRGRDRDRDGVPDRFDRSPNNPYRY